MNLLYEHCINLPDTIHGWSAYKKLVELIEYHREIFPVLRKLASRVSFILCHYRIIMFTIRSKYLYFYILGNSQPSLVASDACDKTNISIGSQHFQTASYFGYWSHRVC